MRNRLMIVAILLLAVASVAASIFAWKSFQQAQQTNQAMLATLERLATSKSTPNQVAVPSDLGTALIRVLKGGENGEPVAGFEAQLSGQPFKENDPVKLIETTDAGGVARFGPIRPGQYGLWMTEDAFDLRYSQNLFVFEGRQVEETVILPDIT